MRIQVDDDIKRIAQDAVEALNTIGSAGCTIAGALNRLNTTLRQRNGHLVTPREEFEAKWLETPPDLSFQAKMSKAQGTVNVTMSQEAYKQWLVFVENFSSFRSETSKNARR